MTRVGLACGVALLLCGCAAKEGGYIVPTLAQGFPLGFNGPCKAHPAKAEIRIFGPRATIVIGGSAALGYYPARALGDGKFGSATLRCAVAGGKATRCQIEREDGPDWGFGRMAQYAARDLEVPPVGDGPDVQLDYQFLILDAGFGSVYDEAVIGTIRRCEERGMTPFTDAAAVRNLPYDGGAPASPPARP